MRLSGSSASRFQSFLAVLALAGLALWRRGRPPEMPASGPGRTSTNWDTATNWSTCGSSFPDTTSDTATISTGTPHDNPVVAAGDSFTVSTLTINGGTLAVNGTLAIQGNSTGAGNIVVASGGTLNWRSGTMSGTARRRSRQGAISTLNLSPGTLQRALVNHGTVTASGNSYVNVGVGGLINNGILGHRRMTRESSVPPRS